MSDHDGDVPDFELVRKMADEANDSSAARKAWGELYVRHHRSLSRISASAFGAAERPCVQDIVQEAFMKAFQAADTFDFGEQVEPDIQTKKVRAWLARITENLMRDRFRGLREVTFMEADEIDRLPATSDAEEDASELEECERLKLLKSGMVLLSDVEQTVLRATSFWLRPAEQHQRMPHEAMAELSTNLGKSPDNIRQIRLRALRKLEKHINDHLGQ